MINVKLVFIILVMFVAKHKKDIPPGRGFEQFEQLVELKILKVKIINPDIFGPVLFLQCVDEDGTIRNIELSTAQIQDEYVRCQPYANEIPDFPN